MVKLGLRLDLFRSASLEVPFDLVVLAETLGYHSVWTAEAYGADAMTPLAALATRTRRIKLGTAVAQMAGRPPAMLAMQAMTVDALAGGNRVIIGIGVSGPQIVEGWYGQPWGHPSARLRDYVQIVRQVLDREGPVQHDGAEISLPYTGPGSIGAGKPLRSILHPAGRVPIWLASVGEKNTALSAELCDGWLPMGIHREGTSAPSVAKSLTEGFARRSAPGGEDDFEIFSGITIEITDDVKGWLDAQRPWRATYIGGMGSQTHNYHVQAMAKQGFEEAAARIQELFLAGRRDDAIAAMPDDYLLSNALVGTAGQIRTRWATERLVPDGVTGLIVSARQPAAIALMAELAGLPG